MSALTSTELGAFNTAAVKGLTTSQIGVLTSSDVAGFNTTEIASLSSTQVHSFTTDVISGLSTSQVPFLLYTKDATDITAGLLKGLNKDAPKESLIPAEGGAPDLNPVPAGDQ